MWLGLALVVCYSFLLRCVLVSRRHLAIQQLRRRRIAATVHSPESVSTAVTHEGMPVAGPVCEDQIEVDLSAVHSQTSRLLRSCAVMALLVGVWLIWVDVLPALRVISHWQLWTIAGEAVSSGRRTRMENRSVRHRAACEMRLRSATWSWPWRLFS